MKRYLFTLLLTLLPAYTHSGVICAEADSHSRNKAFISLLGYEIVARRVVSPDGSQKITLFLPADHSGL